MSSSLWKLAPFDFSLHKRNYMYVHEPIATESVSKLYSNRLKIHAFAYLNILQLCSTHEPDIKENCKKKIHMEKLTDCALRNNDSLFKKVISVFSRKYRRNESCTDSTQVHIHKYIGSLNPGIVFLHKDYIQADISLQGRNCVKYVHPGSKQLVSNNEITPY